MATSLLRSLTDTTPVFIYGSQMFISAFLSMVYGSFIWLGREWRFIFIPVVVIFYAIIYVMANFKRRRVVASAMPAA